MTEYDDIAQFKITTNNESVKFKSFTHNKYKYQQNRNVILSQLYQLSSEKLTTQTPAQQSNQAELSAQPEIPLTISDTQQPEQEPTLEPEVKTGILSGLSKVLTSNKQHTSTTSTLPKQPMPSVFQSAVEKRQLS
ncbi:hypothetical protein [Celerinatantimonas sp. MCCC 1A17872]|uniref:hypothetical protein n=1 Tax=Celerinatantimonas sp. MCCC 1A17872 TaxID=3177514 RepID=UPI0038CA2365